MSATWVLPDLLEIHISHHDEDGGIFHNSVTIHAEVVVQKRRKNKRQLKLLTEIPDSIVHSKPKSAFPQSSETCCYVAFTKHNCKFSLSFNYVSHQFQVTRILEDFKFLTDEENTGTCNPYNAFHLPSASLHVSHAIHPLLMRNVI